MRLSRSCFCWLLKRSKQHQILAGAIVRDCQDLRALHALVAPADVTDNAVKRERATYAASVEIPNLHPSFAAFHGRLFLPGDRPEYMKPFTPRLGSGRRPGVFRSSPQPS